ERHGSALSGPSRFSAAVLTPTPTEVGIISQNSIWGILMLMDLIGLIIREIVSEPGLPHACRD
ncbi:MAG: hypothetical protein M1600_14035, partial [Firmicutes bacterium]|nr:hypothetical protein [Bacillota bacterium]